MPVLVRYLEMTRPPAEAPPSPPLAGLAWTREPHFGLAAYRALMARIGDLWQWDSWRKLGDPAITAMLEDPGVDLLVLRHDGVPAGIGELDARQPAQVEIRHFGLIPELIGRGVGRWFLAEVLQAAWRRGPSRVWLHTDSEDHPQALANYQRAGFVQYREAIED